MLLAIDVGNTNIVFGLYRGRELAETFRIAADRAKTSDEYGALIVQMLSLRKTAVDRIDAAIVASVVPHLTEVLVRAIRAVFAREPMVVGGPGLKTGIAVHYEPPRDVGADRIVNAVAAFERKHQGVIVVDFGTATTFDCVSPKGEYLGGVIVPGIQVSLDALLGRAAKLTHIEIAEPPGVVGRNTPHALQSGIVYGYAALVDGLVDKLRDELQFPCDVIATGGLAPLIVKHTARVEEIAPHLTLEGLAILHERNAGAPVKKARGRDGS